MNKKKLAKWLCPIMLIACAAVYLWVPGAKTVTQQSVKATKAVAAHYAPTDAVDAANIRQVITKDSTTSRTIMWQSSFSEDKAVVEYRRKDSGDLWSVPASSEEFTDDDTTTYIHTAVLTDLTPGTSYE